MLVATVMCLNCEICTDIVRLEGSSKAFLQYIICFNVSKLVQQSFRELFEFLYQFSSSSEKYQISPEIEIKQCLITFDICMHAKITLKPFMEPQTSTDV